MLSTLTDLETHAFALNGEAIRGHVLIDPNRLAYSGARARVAASRGA